MSYRIHRFSIPVNCYLSDNSPATDKQQDFEEIYDDCGFIILPESYTDNGKPTRLVISCHGAGEQCPQMTLRLSIAF